MGDRICKQAKDKKIQGQAKEIVSAFRAVKAAEAQRFPAGPTPNQITYPNEIFDLKNEYDQRTSIFSPRQGGVYSIIAGVGFNPDVLTNYSVRMLIVVNDNVVVAHNDFFGQEVPFGNLVNISAILFLNAGDRVRIFANSTTDGVFFADPLVAHFEAARFPSPAIDLLPRN